MLLDSATLWLLVGAYVLGVAHGIFMKMGYDVWREVRKNEG